MDIQKMPLKTRYTWGDINSTYRGETTPVAAIYRGPTTPFITIVGAHIAGISGVKTRVFFAKKWK